MNNNCKNLYSLIIFFIICSYLSPSTVAQEQKLSIIDSLNSQYANIVLKMSVDTSQCNTYFVFSIKNQEYLVCTQKDLYTYKIYRYNSAFDYNNDEMRFTLYGTYTLKYNDELKRIFDKKSYDINFLYYDDPLIREIALYDSEYMYYQVMLDGEKIVEIILPISVKKHNYPPIIGQKIFNFLMRNMFL